MSAFLSSPRADLAQPRPPGTQTSISSPHILQGIHHYFVVVFLLAENFMEKNEEEDLHHAMYLLQMFTADFSALSEILSLRGPTATLLSFPILIPVFLAVLGNAFLPSNLHSLLTNTKAFQFT